MSHTRRLSPTTRSAFFREVPPRRTHFLEGPQGELEVCAGDELWDTVARRTSEYEAATRANGVSPDPEAVAPAEVAPMLGRFVFEYALPPGNVLEHDCS